MSGSIVAMGGGGFYARPSRLRRAGERVRSVVVRVIDPLTGAVGAGAPGNGGATARRWRVPQDRRVLLAVLYLVVLAVLEGLRRIAHLVDPDVLASTPARIAHGEWWGLITSGLVVDGQPLPQLVGLAIAAVLLIRRAGSGTLWRAAATAHVGSAVIAYAAVGLIALATPSAVERVSDLPDYGISCVWGGILGALAVTGAVSVRRHGPRREAALVLLCVAWLVASVATWPRLTAAEHLLSFLIGAAVVGVPALRASRRAAERVAGG
ncbi:MAG: hypothetical protein QOJ82_3819 [Solirubrobacteraceae bacterium]|nr:hypothetical protein [Solirubrobacteraceae bacterium]